MKDARSFTPGEWARDSQTFIFQCNDPRRGNHWTFCIEGATLQELDPRRPFAAAEAFDELREGIYRAAFKRMLYADSKAPQTLSVVDIRCGCDEVLNEGSAHRAAVGMQIDRAVASAWPH
jgi:hypothetical protein